MPENKSRAKGEAAYRKVDGSLGVSNAGWRKLPVVRWILGGRTPRLWTYSRLCLVLGVFSLLCGLVLGVIGAAIIGINFGLGGAGFAVDAVITAFTLSTPGAIFIVGSGVLAYLAARNDRESQVRTRDFETSEPGIDFVGPPVPGIVPKMDLGDYEDHKNDDPA